MAKQSIFDQSFVIFLNFFWHTNGRCSNLTELYNFAIIQIFTYMSNFEIR